MNGMFTLTCIAVGIVVLMFLVSCWADGVEIKRRKARDLARAEYEAETQAAWDKILNQGTPNRDEASL